MQRQGRRILLVYLQWHIRERLGVAGTAFMPGEKPLGRCAGREVEFEALEGAVSGLAFVPEPSQRRARRRYRRY